jgi:hypothetical protein
VFTSHAPLVGQYSYAGHVTGKSTYSLGPMLYWLLALPAHFGSPASITWTMAVVNTLAIIGVVALARRRGGLVLMFAAAVAVALMCQSIAAETLHDIWNPSAGLLPFTLLIFLCWSLACGEYRLLPLTALVASFMLQDNLMYLPPTLGLLAVAFGGLLVSRIWPLGRPNAAATVAGREEVGENADGDTPPSRAGAGRESALPGTGARRSLLRWSAAALAVAAICWSAPLIQQFSESPGNMTLVVQSATKSKQTLGTSVGWHAVVRAVGVRPWWLYVPIDRWQRQHDIRHTPRTLGVISCIALLTALLVALLAGLARGRRDVVAGALIGFVLCGALAAVAATTPTPRLLAVSLGYTMWEGSQAGMWVWLMLAWSAWLGLGWARRAWTRPRPVGLEASRRSASARRPRIPSLASPLAPVLACAAGLGVTGAVGVAVAASAKPDEHMAVYRPTASLAASLERAIPAGRSVKLLANLGYSTMVIKPAIRYFLARHGVRALGQGSKARIGDWYELYDRPYQYVVYLRDGVNSPASGSRLIDQVSVVDGTGTHVVSEWISARPPARGSARQASAG